MPEIMMKRYREIYRAEQLPVFQNRMFQSEEEAKNCVKGDILLVQDFATGLIFNQAFKPELMQYDADYQRLFGNCRGIKSFSTTLEFCVTS